MPTTRRTQLLMDPEEYRRLRALAKRQKTSVGALVRAAVRATYLTAQPPDRGAVVQEILQMRLPTTDWKKVRREIENSHASIS